MAEAVDVPQDKIEHIISMLVKVFVENGIDKPTSGVAMMFLIERLKAEGYQFVMIPLEAPSGEVH